MTAADKDHTSYGCGSNSELTFFGRAVFDEQLLTTLSFEDAFARAVPVIKQREIDAKKDDGFSNPQISIGTKIRIVLDELASHTVKPGSHSQTRHRTSHVVDVLTSAERCYDAAAPR